MFYCDASKKWAQATVYTVNIKTSRKQDTRSLTSRFVSAKCWWFKICCRVKRGEHFFNCHIEIVKIWAILGNNTRWEIVLKNIFFKKKRASQLGSTKHLIDIYTVSPSSYSAGSHFNIAMPLSTLCALFRICVALFQQNEALVIFCDAPFQINEALFLLYRIRLKHRVAPLNSSGPPCNFWMPSFNLLTRPRSYLLVILSTLWDHLKLFDAPLNFAGINFNFVGVPFQLWGSNSKSSY